MNARALVGLCAVALVSASGCVGPSLETHPTVPRAANVLPASLVVDDVAARSMTGDESLDTNVAESLDDELVRDFRPAAARVVPESEVGHTGVGGPAFELSYRVVRAVSQEGTVPPEATAFTVLGVLTLGLGAIPVSQMHRTNTDVALVELRVYDLRRAGLRVVQDPVTGKLERRYDTTDAPLVLRTHYWIEARRESGVTGGDGGPVDRLRLEENEGIAYARELYAKSLHDVDDAIGRALEETPAPLPPPAPNVALP